MRKASYELDERFKFISNTPYCFKQPFVGYTLKLLTKPFYVYVNGTGVAKIIKAPDLVEKLISCKYSVAI